MIIGFIGKRGSGKCASADSLVTMADGTTKKICDVIIGEKIISYNEEGLAFINEVKDSVDVGQKQGFRLSLVGGESIITSKDHKFLKVTKKTKPLVKKKTGEMLHALMLKPTTVTEWKWSSLEELKVGDQIAITKRYPRNTFDYYSEEIYFLIGYLIGNGCLRGQGVSVSIPNNKTVISYVESMIPSSMKLYKKTGDNVDYYISSRKKPYRAFGKAYNPIKEILNDIGLWGELSYEKHIPRRIMCASEKNLWRVLSGLLSSDGWVDKHCIGYGTTSKKLKDDISTLLKNLGVSYSVALRRVKLNGRQMRSSYQFSINRIADLQRISENCLLIGKEEKLFPLLNSKPLKPFIAGHNVCHVVADMEFCFVRKIEETGLIPMWDLEVSDEGHNYIANNIIVHNTLSMTRECHKYFQRGYRVLSNYHLNFPHQLVDFDELFELAETQADMGNVVLALDEIHILLDSRSGMSKENKVMTFWLNQTRKMNITLLFTTQFLHQVDLRLRSNTDVITLCDGLTVSKIIDGERKEFFICQNEMVFGDEFKRELFVGNDFFPLYETRQVIRFLSRKAKIHPNEAA